MILFRERNALMSAIFIKCVLLLFSCVSENDLNDISNHVDQEDGKIAEIQEMIQSVIVIPTCSDGSVGIDRGVSQIKFEILPLEAARKLPSIPLSSFSLECVSTILTRSEGGGGAICL